MLQLETVLENGKKWKDIKRNEKILPALCNSLMTCTESAVTRFLSFHIESSPLCNRPRPNAWQWSIQSKLKWSKMILKWNDELQIGTPIAMLETLDRHTWPPPNKVLCLSKGAVLCSYVFIESRPLPYHFHDGACPSPPFKVSPACGEQQDFPCVAACLHLFQRNFFVGAKWKAQYPIVLTVKFEMGIRIIQPTLSPSEITVLEWHS